MGGGWGIHGFRLLYFASRACMLICRCLCLIIASIYVCMCMCVYMWGLGKERKTKKQRKAKSTLGHSKLTTPLAHPSSFSPPPLSQERNHNRLPPLGAFRDRYVALSLSCVCVYGWLCKSDTRLGVVLEVVGGRKTPDCTHIPLCNSSQAILCACRRGRGGWILF